MIRFKRNYVKRQGQGSDATGPTQWEKCVVALGRCRKRRRDEEKKSRLAIGNLDQKSLGDIEKGF
jgi:hypothetical protein